MSQPLTTGEAADTPIYLRISPWVKSAEECHGHGGGEMLCKAIAAPQCFVLQAYSLGNSSGACMPACRRCLGRA